MTHAPRPSMSARLRAAPVLLLALLAGAHEWLVLWRSRRRGAGIGSHPRHAPR